MNRAGRMAIAVILAIATLGFGAAGLCGAAFTLMSLPDVFSSRHENYAGAALVIAVPSLLIGGAVAWWCGRMLWRLLKRRP
jgi:multisubunit Na+/H+ antiporter MnhG subunit